MSIYGFYPGIDESGNFSPVVRAAFAASLELAARMAIEMPELLLDALSTNPEIHADLIAKIADLTLAEFNLVRKSDPGIPFELDDNTFRWIVMDPTGRVALGVTIDGSVRAPRISADILALYNRASIYSIEEGEYSWAVIDNVGNLSELRLDNSGRMPDDVLQAWADRMSWNSEDIAETVADSLAEHEAGLEIGSAERATDYSTTVTAAGTKIPGLVLNVTGSGRPVDLEARISNCFHSVANTGVNGGIYVNGTQIQGDVVYSPQTAKGPSLKIKQRMVLLDGIDYTIEVDLWGNAAGTCTMDVAATKPSTLTATNR